jgi:hypothetical protein
LLKLATFWCGFPGEFRQAEWVQLDLDVEKRAYIVPPRIRKLLEAAKENPNTLLHIGSSAAPSFRDSA